MATGGVLSPSEGVLRTGRTSLLVVALLVAAGVLAGVPPVPLAAADAAVSPREVRSIYPAELGLPSPRMITYAPGEQALLIAGDRSESRTLWKLSLAEVPTGTIEVDTTIADLVAMTVDTVGDRLVLVDAASPGVVTARGADTRKGGRVATVRAPHAPAEWGAVAGAAFDPATGSLHVLDGDAGVLRQIEPAGGGRSAADIAHGDVVSETTLDDVAVALRGLAVEPTTGRLFAVSHDGATLFELDRNAGVVAHYDVGELELTNPTSMVFAPSGDPTDSAEEQSLYIVDAAAPSTAGGTGEGRIVEVTFEALVAPTVTDVAVLVQTINTFQFNPPSPDPSGITYLPSRDRLLMSDSEVNEMTIFQNVNLFELTRTGSLRDTGVTLNWSNEPTGITYNPTNDHIFISDDNKRRIFEVDPGADGRYGTPGDVVTSFATLPLGIGDPEDVAYDPLRNELVIIDGVGQEIYRIDPGPNRIFDGVDDVVTNFDTQQFGTSDPEGVAYNASADTYLIADRGPDLVFEVTPSGSLIRTIDVSAAPAATGAQLRSAGIAVAPHSSIPGKESMYIVDRGVDNNVDPNENDGRIYELYLPGSSPSVTIVATDATAAEPGGDVGVFTVTRSGSTAGRLDVAYAVSGSASPSSDYTALPGSVSIPDGQSSASITVTPIDDAISEPDETVVVTLIAGAGYVVGVPGTATVTIRDDDGGGQIGTVYVSSTSGGKAGGVSFADEDILAWNSQTQTWAMHFDGSDVGLSVSGADVDAFELLADGSILMSFDGAPTIPNVGLVADADIVRFIPTSLGPQTAGTFEWYFDGSDVDLTTSGEDIDAIDRLADGRLVISTRGSFSVTGASGKDEDLLVFTPSALGAATSGTWGFYFDGSDVGLDASSEDVNGASIDEASGAIHFSVTGAFTVTGLSGDGADIVTCMPSSLGPNTACSFSMLWDGSTFGFAGEVVDGFARTD